ncbi:MAG: hypothetical protein LAN83_17775 [Acidobacteriia bacterium]|nr:hypothetical protein [Terriglobia bacterium]
MTPNTVCANLLVVMFAVLTAVTTSAQAGSEVKPAASAMPPELQRVRAALEKYQDPVVAIRDGYLSTLACINFPNRSLPGHEQYPKGAMGVHFLNAQLIGPVLDPMKPQILLYEPEAGGKLRLTGAEWFVPLAMAKERPRIFDHDLLGPMEGHEPLIPAEMAHYDLHVWLFKDNPEGMFAPTNPAVKCAGYSYALDLDSTKMVAEGMKH